MITVAFSFLTMRTNQFIFFSSQSDHYTFLWRISGFLGIYFRQVSIKMTSSRSCRDSRVLLGHFFSRGKRLRRSRQSFPSAWRSKPLPRENSESEVSRHSPEGYVASSPLNRYRCVSRDCRFASPRIFAGLTFVKFIWARDIGKHTCIKTDEWRDQRGDASSRARGMRVEETERKDGGLKINRE